MDGLELDVPQPVSGEVELLDDPGGAHERVIAVADVHPGAVERADRRGAAPDRVAGLEHEDVEPRPREVGGAGQAVVARSHDDRVMAHVTFPAGPLRTPRPRPNRPLLVSDTETSNGRFVRQGGSRGAGPALGEQPAQARSDLALLRRAQPAVADDRRPGDDDVARATAGGAPHEARH